MDKTTKLAKTIEKEKSGIRRWWRNQWGYYYYDTWAEEFDREINRKENFVDEKMWKKLSDYHWFIETEPSRRLKCHLLDLGFGLLLILGAGLSICLVILLILRACGKA